MINMRLMWCGQLENWRSRIPVPVVTKNRRAKVTSGRGVEGGSAFVLLALRTPLLLSACSSSPSGTSSSSTESSSNQTLRIIVTNDDGFSAPGINAVVQGLRTLPLTSVTVVAPLTNESGTGGQTTPSSSGPLVTSAAQTQSGYPATAVHGYPADTVIWAVKDHGLSFKTGLVVSGIDSDRTSVHLQGNRGP